MAEVAVLGVPDARWGEIVVAFVAPRAARLDAEVLDAWPGPAWPATSSRAPIEFVGEFPRTPTGKVRKRDLREQLHPPIGGKC